MQFFGSVTRIVGACVPSVAPCAVRSSHVHDHDQPYPAALRGEQSTTIRLLFSTRAIHGFPTVSFPRPRPFPRRGNLACPRFLSSRTIPITKVPCDSYDF